MEKFNINFLKLNLISKNDGVESGEGQSPLPSKFIMKFKNTCISTQSKNFILMKNAKHM